MGGTRGNDVFFYLLFGSVRTGIEHEMLTMFLKINPAVFLGFENKANYKFILAFYERLYKLGISINLGLSSCLFNFMVRLRSGGDLMWNANLILYLHLLGSNCMLLEKHMPITLRD